jgi:predicted DNA-binding transcriptional regulator YafY
MATPTSRLLELLELLQTQPLTTGQQVADQLGIDRRTVRRYVATLQELGIPVEGERGVGGGYRVRPGFRLPPLMLSDEEAIVVVLGLLAARRLGLDTPSESVEGALTKIHRVLPDAIRRRVEALEETLEFTTSAKIGAPVPGDTVLLLAEAIRRRKRVHMRYRTFEGEETQRELSAHGLVVHSGRWYLAAFDHGRDDMRTFRVDRMDRARVGDDAAVDAPPDFSAVEHVSRSLARTPWQWEVAVLLHLPLEEASRRIPATLAELAETNGGTLLRMRAGSLDWMASVLAGLDCEFTISAPDELRSSVAVLAARLAAAARS